MPFYLIRCDKCGIEWDVKGSMSKPPTRAKCKKCKKYGKRVLTANPVHFYGPGFYCNDYKK